MLRGKPLLLITGIALVVLYSTSYILSKNIAARSISEAIQDPETGESQWRESGGSVKTSLLESAGDIPLQRPRLYDTWKNFAEENDCETNDEHWASVDSQMNEFRRRGVGKQMIDDLKDLPHISYCTVNNGKLTPEGCWPEQVIDLIKPALDLMPNGMVLVLNNLDEPRILAPSREYSYELPLSEIQKLHRDDAPQGMKVLCAKHPAMSSTNIQHNAFLYRPASMHLSFNLSPMFSMAAIPGCFADIAVPTTYATGVSETIDVKSPSWDEKRSQIFWRGSSTGTNYQTSDLKMENMLRSHRIRTVYEFQKKTEDFDIGLTAFIQCQPDSVCKEMEAIVGTKDGVPQNDQMNFKYLLDMDGNSFSQRFVWMLRHSQSLILKMALFDDWATLVTKPFEHYVPVKFDLSDMESTLQWARKHDGEARKIAQQARDFAQKRLRRKDMQCHWFRTLMNYEDAWALGVKNDVVKNDVVKNDSAENIAA